VNRALFVRVDGVEFVEALQAVLNSFATKVYQYGTQRNKGVD
jgi:hypothetical protein